MKKRIGILLSLVLVMLCVYALADVTINEENFPDENFRNVVVAYDTDSDGSLSDAEIAAVEKMDAAGKDIADLIGIQHFSALKELDCKDNRLEALDLSGNTVLESLICSGNRLAELDVSTLEKLDDINCASNQLTILKLNQKLTYLKCSDNLLEDLDVSKNTKLRNLICSGNRLKNLDVTENTRLLYLTCSDNRLENLDISRNEQLQKLSCEHNQITIIRVWNVPGLDTLVREKDYQLEDRKLIWSADDDGDGKTDRLLCIDLSVRVNPSSEEIYGGLVEISEALFPDPNFREYIQGFDSNSDGFLSAGERSQYVANFEAFNCSGRSIASLQGIEYFEIFDLICSDNLLTSLDLRHNEDLITINCTNNQLTSLRVGWKVERLFCYSNDLVQLDVSDNSNLCMAVRSGREHAASGEDCFECMNDDQGSDSYGAWYYLSVDPQVTVIAGDIISEGTGSHDIPPDPEEESVVIDEDHFPDPAFREIVQTFDENGDDRLNRKEMLQIRSIDCEDCSVSSLQGVEYLTALEELYCTKNYLTSLDLRENSALRVLDCEKNNLTKLKVNGCGRLEELYCRRNRFDKLDLGGTEILFTISLMEIDRIHKDYGYDYYEYSEYDPEEGFYDDSVICAYFDQNVTIYDGSTVFSEPVASDVIFVENGVYKLDSSKQTAMFTAAENQAITKLIIQDTVKDKGITYKVIAIADSACKAMEKLQKVTIGENIKMIGEKAFYQCPALKKVTGGAAVTEIGESAFCRCLKLTALPAFKKLSSIGRRAFMGCAKLAILPALTKVSSIGEEAFRECVTLTTVKLGENIKKIPDSTFYGCVKLQEITGGKNVKTIGPGAFKGCSALQTFAAFPKLQKIGNNAFEACKSLVKITIPEKVTTIGQFAFRDCSKLKTIVIKTKVLTSVGPKAFHRIYSKPTVTCPKGMKKTYQKLLLKKGMSKKAVFK